MLIRTSVRSVLTGFAIVMATSLPAAAHVGHGGTESFVHGFAHPMGGIDHMLAMVSVGILAAVIGGRFNWILPAAFLSMMSFGAALAMAGMNLPFIELGISLSVVVLGLAVALQLPLPMIWTTAIVGFLAVFHGFAHGSEMPVDASGLSYGSGFLLATALLHLAGLAIGFVAGRWASSAHTVSRVAGGAIAIAGFVLTAGA